MSAPHPCSECTPRSQPYCGFCGDGPYSPTGPFAARKFVPQEPRAVTKESLLAEFDARAAMRREQVAAEFKDFDKQRSGAKKAARKPRRTKQQMAEHRASVQERISKSYRELVGDGTANWLDEPDPLLQKILEAPREP